MQGIQKFHRTLPERRKKKSCADLRAQVPPNRLLECSTKKPSQFWKTGQHPRGTSLEERVHLQNPKKEHAPSRRKTFFRDPILLSLEGRNAYRKTKKLGKKKRDLNGTSQARTKRGIYHPNLQLGRIYPYALLVIINNKKFIKAWANHNWEAQD